MPATYLIEPTTSTQDYILPAASLYTSQSILVKNTSLTGVDLVIRTQGFNFIDGRVTVMTLPDNGSVTFFSDGKTWWSMAIGMYDPVTDPLRVAVNG